MADMEHLCHSSPVTTERENVLPIQLAWPDELAKNFERQLSSETLELLPANLMSEKLANRQI